MLGGDPRDVGGRGGDYGCHGRHDGAGHHGWRLGPLGGAPAPDDVHPLGRSSCWRRRRVVHIGRSILLWLIWNPRGLKAALGTNAPSRPREVPMTKRIHGGVTPQQASELVTRLKRDLRSSGYGAREGIVDAVVVNALTLVADGGWPESTVGEEVHWRFNDGFMDTVWPTCPGHHQQRLCLHDVAWVG